MPHKSHLRTMVTSRWLRWALVRALCRALPALSRRWTFPLRSVRALDVADRIFVNRLDELRFGSAVDPAVVQVLDLARTNDTGDTSTYGELRSPVSSWLVRIRDCVISGRTHGVMCGRDLAIVAREPVAPNWNVAKPERLETVAAAPVLHLALTSGGHYYHFYANDLVPLMHALAEHHAEIGPLRVVVPDPCPAYVEASLRALARAYPQVGICRLGRRQRLVGVDVLWQSRSAITLEWMPVTPEEAQSLTKLLCAEYALPPVESAPEPRRLFVSRGTARLRRLLNEPELRNALQGEGFETFVPASDNHARQIDLFRRADVVVAVHGAALTNLLFCRPGTLVVELFPQDRVKSTYAWLAHRLGLRYQAVRGSRGNLQQGFSIEPADVIAALR